MTSTGRGTAKSSTNSMRPRSIHESISRVVMARTLSSRVAIVRGENALETSRRCRVWSGASAAISIGSRGWPSSWAALTRASSSLVRGIRARVRREEKVAGSRSTSRTRSWRVTRYSWLDSTQCTGSSARMRS